MPEKTFNYKGKDYSVMTLDKADEERERRTVTKEKVCIISCYHIGGDKDDYIVVAEDKR